MFEKIIFLLFLFSPAAIANMVPPIIRHIPILKNWKQPLDFGLSINGKRALGENKTFRGLITGVLGGMFAGFICFKIYQSSGYLRSIDFVGFNQFDYILWGGLAGFGALFGDAVESFFKRQRGIAPGKLWFPFDQLDLLFGAILFTGFYYNLAFMDYVLLIVPFLLGHVLIKFISYKIGVEDKWI